MLETPLDPNFALAILALVSITLSITALGFKLRARGKHGSASGMLETEPAHLPRESPPASSTPPRGADPDR